MLCNCLCANGNLLRTVVLVLEQINFIYFHISLHTQINNITLCNCQALEHGRHIKIPYHT